MALVRDYGKVKKVTDKIMLGYDDIYSIQYFGTNLRPYWNSRGDRTIESEMLAAYNEYDELLARCYAFDKKLMEDASAVGGKGICRTLRVGLPSVHCRPQAGGSSQR